MKNFDELIQAGGKKAIRHYWRTRTGQLSPRRDGGKVRDQGRRAEVTGGKQLDGFLWLIRDLLKAAGVKNADEIFCEKAQREGLYDATAFLMSDQRGGLKGEYIEPSGQLTLKTLAAEIYGKAIAYCKQRETAAKKTGGV